MKDKLLQIISHYGIDKQLKYIHSEYFELDEAILNEREISFNSEGDIGDLLTLNKAKEHITEEIADDMLYELKQENEELKKEKDNLYLDNTLLKLEKDIYKQGYEEFKELIEKTITEVNNE